MNENKIIPNNYSKHSGSIYLIPDELLDNWGTKQDRILEILEAKKEVSLNGFITERKASEIINKKTTWFWQMRKTGRLPFKKIGKTIYYLTSDVTALLDGEK